MPQPLRRSTIVLTPDYFGNFTRELPDLSNVFYEGQRIEVDVLLSNTGDVLAYQPKGDITGLPAFIQPHEITFRPNVPPAPKADPKQRVAVTKDGAIA